MSMHLEAQHIKYRYQQGPLILSDVNLELKSGERVGLVGPSGYGKSTLAQILAGYLTPLSGNVFLDGRPLPVKGYSPVQLIYQHPEKAVNPRWKMKDILTEGWQPDDQLIMHMGIKKEWLTRWPQELSGGELQRFCIARALSPATRFLIADEISTMLDAITQAQIWNTLLAESEKRNLGMVIITHNEKLAQRLCTRIIDLREINRLPDPPLSHHPSGCKRFP